MALHRDEIADALIAELVCRDGLSARQLAKLIDVDKSTINSVLHARKSEFEKTTGTPPTWSLVTTSPRIQPVQRLSPQAIPAVVATVGSVDVDANGPTALYGWQQAALDAWRENDRCGIVEAVTGAGKTRVGISAIAEQLDLGGRTVIVVPTIELMHQWHKQLERQLSSATVGLLGDGYHQTLDDCDVLISTVDSARALDLRLREDGADLIVADECHRYASTENRLALEDGFAARLGLTATLVRSDGLEEEVLLPYFDSVVYRLGYRQAIDEEVVARFDVVAASVDLTAAEAVVYEELTEKVSKAKWNLIQNFGVPAEPFEVFLRAVNRMRTSGTMAEGMAAGRYWGAFTKRRQLLAETNVKCAALVKLAPAIQAAGRTLIFTQTIKSAQRAVDSLQTCGIEALAVHSKTDRSVRRNALKAFGAGTCRALVAPKVLDEGIDVPEADLGIIVASSQQRRQMIQRMGRVLRPKSDGRKARFVVLYATDTSEDPAGGAHEAFFDEIDSVADHIDYVSMDRAPQDAVRLLVGR